MANEKAFPTDEACALALLNRELQEAVALDLSDETKKVLQNCIDGVVGRLAGIGADWQNSRSVATPETETAVEAPSAPSAIASSETTPVAESQPDPEPEAVPAETPVPTESSPNTSSMPDSVVPPTPAAESVTP